LTDLAKTSMGSSHGRNDIESSERAGGGNRGAPESGQVVAVGMGDLFDQAEQVQSSELARQHRRRQVQRGNEVGSSPAMDVELAALQGAQQRLVGLGEEVDPLDGWLGAHTWLAQAPKVAFSCARVVEAGQECKVAQIAAKQDLAQVGR